MQPFSDHFSLFIGMLPQEVPYRIPRPSLEVLEIEGSRGAYIDALWVSLAIIPGITQVADERHG